jgi:hypothetical protein
MAGQDIDMNHEEGVSDSAPINYMDIAEFREFGFLQEVNRQFFHPLGLALETAQDECGTCGGDGIVRQEEGTPVACVPCGGTGFIERLGGVWDYRDDPEGMVFGDGYGMDPEKAARVEAERAVHVATRIETLGLDDLPVQRWTIQPLPKGPSLKGGS